MTSLRKAEALNKALNKLENQIVMSLNLISLSSEDEESFKKLFSYEKCGVVRYFQLKLLFYETLGKLLTCEHKTLNALVCRRIHRLMKMENPAMGKLKVFTKQ